MIWHRSSEERTGGPFALMIPSSPLQPTTSLSQSRLAYLIALKCPQWTKSKAPSTYTLTGWFEIVSSICSGDSTNYSSNLTILFALCSSTGDAFYKDSNLLRASFNASEF